MPHQKTPRVLNGKSPASSPHATHPECALSMPGYDTSVSTALLGVRSEVRVSFPTARFASMAVATLVVDEELQPDKITKAIRQEGQDLVV